MKTSQMKAPKVRAPQLRASRVRASELSEGTAGEGTQSESTPSEGTPSEGTPNETESTPSEGIPNWELIVARCKRMRMMSIKLAFVLVFVNIRTDCNFFTWFAPHVSSYLALWDLDFRTPECQYNQYALAHICIAPTNRRRNGSRYLAETRSSCVVSI